MSWLDQVIGYGTHAARPAAGSPGRLYYETDTDTLLRDNGTTWDALALAGGGAAPLVLVSPSPSAVPLVVEGAVSQSGDLQQWQDSTGAVLAKLAHTGVLSAATINSGSSVNASTDVTASELWCTTTNTNSIRDGTGTVTGLRISATGGATVPSANASYVPLTVKGAPSQTADLQQWQDSTGAITAKVDAGGGISPTNGARLTSGVGAPTTPGGANPTPGDVYLRTDTPTVANQRVYICTLGGASPTWTGLV